jgi:hypothetical protein
MEHLTRRQEQGIERADSGEVESGGARPRVEMDDARHLTSWLYQTAVAMLAIQKS